MTNSPRPIRLGEIELCDPIAALRPEVLSKRTGTERLRLLVRHHRAPIGFLDVTLGAAGISADDVVGLVRSEFGPELEQRLGSIAVQELGTDGLGWFVNGSARPVNRTPITVVIATRERPDALERCLASHFASDRPDEPVIVVDNAPLTEATTVIVERLQAEGRPVTYVREPRPGLGRAHNAALPFVTTPLVAFTDDDVLIDRSWLDALDEAFRVAPDVACVTGMIVPAELETPAQQWVEDYAGFGKGFQRTIFDLDRHRPADRLFPFTAGSLGSGANMAFRTSYLCANGGFADALGAGTLARGGDDLAAFHDVIVRGHQLVYEPAAIVRHHHHRTEEALRRQLHGYGVGLGAYLTHVVVTRPWSLVSMLRHGLAGVRHITDDDSSKNARRPEGFPADLISLERRGMLAGPWWYVRSRLRISAENRAARGKGTRP